MSYSLRFCLILLLTALAAPHLAAATSPAPTSLSAQSLAPPLLKVLFSAPPPLRKVAWIEPSPSAGGANVSTVVSLLHPPAPPPKRVARAPESSHPALPRQIAPRRVARVAARPPVVTTPRRNRPVTLWDRMDSPLQQRLERAVRSVGLDGAVRKRHLALALVDISRLDRPRVAAMNGDRMMYAASLPKIAILLAAFEKMDLEGRSLDRKTRGQLLRMIRQSSNRDATAVIHQVGKPFLNRVLTSKRYGLYNPEHNGGLWVGKDYGKGGLWKRDPLHNLSHGATAMQVARFYYLLETGRLVNAESSRMMKEILADTAIWHKFKRGLDEIHPDARIYRKSGSWRHFHSDSALIERDGIRYIAVGLARDPQGGQWLQNLIGAMDRAVDPPITLASARFDIVPRNP